MEGFPPEHLDLDKLHAQLALRQAQLDEAVRIVTDLPEGEERFAWAAEVSKAREDIPILKQLIEEKLEYDRAGERST